MKNIDYYITLNKKQKNDVFYDICSKVSFGGDWLEDFVIWLNKEYKEQIKLNEKQLKAVKLCIDMGMPWIEKTPSGSVRIKAKPENISCIYVCCVPSLVCLDFDSELQIPKLITEEPLDLRTII